MNRPSALPPFKPLLAPSAKPTSQPRYGRTWWGAQWLLVLSQIDHHNRLPRGRSHANRSAVCDLVAADFKVTARVQGSHPQPYEVDIGVPKVAGPQPVGCWTGWPKTLAWRQACSTANATPACCGWPSS